MAGENVRGMREPARASSGARTTEERINGLDDVRIEDMKRRAYLIE